MATITGLAYAYTGTVENAKLHQLTALEGGVVAEAGTSIRLDDDQADDMAVWLSYFTDLAAGDYLLIVYDQSSNVPVCGSGIRQRQRTKEEPFCRGAGQSLLPFPKSLLALRLLLRRWSEEQLTIPQRQLYLLRWLAIYLANRSPFMRQTAFLH